MKIYIANDSKQSLGGGWTFLRNFEMAVNHSDSGGLVTPLLSDSDVVFLPSSSMVKSETVAEAKRQGKKIVLRVDNIPRDSRNRNTGISRLESYYEQADGVIYQSRWAESYVGGWLTHKIGIRRSIVIYNGVDTSVFNPNGDKHEAQGKVYVYSRFNRDETKQWHVVWYEFAMLHRAAMLESAATPLPELWLVGQFSPELLSYDPTGQKTFDFFQGERVQYIGVVQNADEYAKILRSANVFLAPYYNDACSNSIIEAFATGVPVETLGYGNSGGTPELFEQQQLGFDWSKERMARQYVNFMQSV